MPKPQPLPSDLIDKLRSEPSRKSRVTVFSPAVPKRSVALPRDLQEHRKAVCKQVYVAPESRTAPPSRRGHAPGSKATALCSKILVALHSTAGYVLEFEVPGDCRTIEVKRKVAARWTIPPAFQQLVVGHKAVLRDYEKFACCCKPEDQDEDDDSGALPVTMRVSWESVLRALQRGVAPARRKSALLALAPLALRDGQGSVAAITALLEHPEADVRSAAVQALHGAADTQSETSSKTPSLGLPQDFERVIAEEPEAHIRRTVNKVRNSSPPRRSSGKQAMATAVTRLAASLGGNRWKRDFSDLNKPAPRRAWNG